MFVRLFFFFLSPNSILFLFTSASDFHPRRNRKYLWNWWTVCYFYLIRSLLVWSVPQQRYRTDAHIAIDTSWCTCIAYSHCVETPSRNRCWDLGSTTSTAATMTTLIAHHPLPNRLIVFHYFMHERYIITHYIWCEYGPAHIRVAHFDLFQTIIVISAHVNTLSLPVMEFCHSFSTLHTRLEPHLSHSNHFVDTIGRANNKLYRCRWRCAHIQV